MELKESIEKRASIRYFLDEKIEINHIRELIRRAGLAPSENNHQPWKFIIITNKNLLKKMSVVVAQKIAAIPFNESKRTYLIKNQMQVFATFFEKAPVLIAVMLTPQESLYETGMNISKEEFDKIQNYPDLQACGAAIQNILLSATEMNYGACWMSSPMTARVELEELLDIKSPSYLAALVALGKPANPAKQSNKKSLDDIILIKE